MTSQALEEFLGPFTYQRICQVIDWMKKDVKRQTEKTECEAGKRSLLKTLHYLFESENRGLAKVAVGSVETLSFSGMSLTPIECVVLSQVIGLSDTIKCLDLDRCDIQHESLQWFGHGLHKCQELSLVGNKLGDSSVELLSAALRNPESKIQKLWLEKVDLTASGVEDLVSALNINQSLTGLNLSDNNLGDSGVKLLIAALRKPKSNIKKLWLRYVGLTASGVEDLMSALSTNRSLTQLYLSDNKLGDSGVKLVSAALRNPEWKIKKLWLRGVGLTDSGAEDLISALSSIGSLTVLDLSYNSLTDQFVSALQHFILTHPRLMMIWLRYNRFSEIKEKELRSLNESKWGLQVDI
ncbi:ribonuclease inhibitor-like [Hemitrygon akajei]|uniref:ribonuclease inhibitor-like n=1 Tax=Hemitrygon akajei TaxID=2704970 RepID=UPI003BF97C54